MRSHYEVFDDKNERVRGILVVWCLVIGGLMRCFSFEAAKRAEKQSEKRGRKGQKQIKNR